jgi:hypothetical protein
MSIGLLILTGVLGVLVLILALHCCVKTPKLRASAAPAFEPIVLRASPGVVQEARFPTTPPTWNSGMQWSHTWRLPHLNRGAVEFQTTLDQGLMLAFSSAMSDTGGGTLMHIRAPSATSDDEVMYGVSDMFNPGHIKAFASQKRSDEPSTQRYRAEYDNGHYKLTDMDTGKVIFETDYPFHNTAANAPQQNIQYFGFGTSSVGNVRTIDAVGISHI